MRAVIYNLYNLSLILLYNFSLILFNSSRVATDSRVEHSSSNYYLNLTHIYYINRIQTSMHFVSQFLILFHSFNRIFFSFIRLISISSPLYSLYLVSSQYLINFNHLIEFKVKAVALNFVARRLNFVARRGKVCILWYAGNPLLRMCLKVSQIYKCNYEHPLPHRGLGFSGSRHSCLSFSAKRSSEQGTRHGIHRIETGFDQKSFSAHVYPGSRLKLPPTRIPHNPVSCRQSVWHRFETGSKSKGLLPDRSHTSTRTLSFFLFNNPQNPCQILTRRYSSCLIQTWQLQYHLKISLTSSKLTSSSSKMSSSGLSYPFLIAQRVIHF